MAKAKKFLEHNYPTLSLYGSESADGNEKAAKIRVAFSRERDDRSKPEQAEVEWVCSMVRSSSSKDSSSPNASLQCTFKNFAGRKVCYKCQTPFAGRDSADRLHAKCLRI